MIRFVDSMVDYSFIYYMDARFWLWIRDGKGLIINLDLD